MSSVGEIVENYALFAGSLSSTTTQESLVQYFSKFGGVQGANLITDWATGASKRCAIVFCNDEATCTLALAFKPHKLDGKQIRVQLADQDKKGTKKISTTNLFVGNIAEVCTEEDIRVLFDKFGSIDTVKFFKNASTKPNTKNAIVQYIDSRSVELAFKSKSDMGTTDDSLKISPLKQKKTSSGRSDQFEDIASMMMHMCAQSLQGNQSLLIEQEDQLASDDFDFPQHPMRKHRKSSSVDMLPASKSNYPELSGFTQQSGSATPSLNPFSLGLTSLMRAQKKTENKPNPVDFRVQKYCQVAEQSDTTPAEVEEEEVVTGQYNFVTLIDLFNEDDDLTTSFYGESPIRKSRAALSS